MVIRAAQEASVLGAESPSTSKEVQDLYEVQFAGLNSRVGKGKGLSNPEVNLYTHTGLFFRSGIFHSGFGRGCS